MCFNLDNNGTHVQNIFVGFYTYIAIKAHVCLEWCPHDKKPAISMCDRLNKCFNQHMKQVDIRRMLKIQYNIDTFVLKSFEWS